MRRDARTEVSRDRRVVMRKKGASPLASCAPVQQIRKVFLSSVSRFLSFFSRNAAEGRKERGKCSLAATCCQDVTGTAQGKQMTEHR